MVETKEKILIAALELFARDGYEAVSVSMIAGELGMTKSALYKHYKNKRDIFDSIVERMQKSDAEQARAYDLPEVALSEMAAPYSQTELRQITEFSLAQFKYWTEDELPSRFRKLLTLEQYRNKEMAQLYQQYLGAGPLAYTEDLFAAMSYSAAEAKRLALELYGPMFLLYSVYDGAADKSSVAVMLREHLGAFIEKLAAVQK